MHAAKISAWALGDNFIPWLCGVWSIFITSIYAIRGAPYTHFAWHHAVTPPRVTVTLSWTHVLTYLMDGPVQNYDLNRMENCFRFENFDLVEINVLLPHSIQRYFRSDVLFRFRLNSFFPSIIFVFISFSFLLTLFQDIYSLSFKF